MFARKGLIVGDWYGTHGLGVHYNGTHALTFGAAHLAAMSFISRAAPVGLSATAQSLYNSLSMGAAIAIAVPLAGVAYKHLGGNAYHIMTALSALAGVLVWLLGRRWDGRRVVLPP